MSDKGSRAEAPRIRWLVEPTFDDDGVQRSAGIDHLGREHGDPVPLRPPVGLSVSQGDELHTQLKKILQRERAAFMAAVQAEEFETEDEANDFLTEDELFPPGNEPWEDVFEFPAEPPEVRPAGGGGGGSSPAASSSPTTNGGNGNHAPPVTAGERSPREVSNEPGINTAAGELPIGSAQRRGEGRAGSGNA